MRERNVTLGNFNDSMNFFFGIIGEYDPESFDMLNNPYIEYVAYRWNANHSAVPIVTQNIAEDYEVIHCSDSFF
jgi:hypothetical protein